MAARTLIWDRKHNTILDPTCLIFDAGFLRREGIVEFEIPEKTTDWVYDGHGGLYLSVNGLLKTHRIQAK